LNGSLAVKTGYSSLIGDKKYVVSGMVFDVVHSELVGLADTAPIEKIRSGFGLLVADA